MFALLSFFTDPRRARGLHADFDNPPRWWDSQPRRAGEVCTFLPMSLQATYDALRAQAVRQLTQGQPDLDPLLRAAAGPDTRRGLTLLARPPARITAVLEEVMADFRRTEPDQYYYPATDIHLTVLSIISCHPGFTLAKINPADYSQAIRAIIPFISPFTVRYYGLTASPGAILAQGFPEGIELAKLRERIRFFFQHADFLHSIDQRYSIQTAHSTLIRFRSNLLDTKQLLNKLKRYEQYFIGTFEINALELVYNDWYQRAENTVVLDKYLLSS